MNDIAKALAISIFAAAVIIYALLVWGVPVEAAQPAPPTVEPCQVVNTFGAIEIARCQPENGEMYYVNSLGFMLAVEE